MNTAGIREVWHGHFRYVDTVTEEIVDQHAELGTQNDALGWTQMNAQGQFPNTGYIYFNHVWPVQNSEIYSF